MGKNRTFRQVSRYNLQTVRDKPMIAMELIDRYETIRVGSDDLWVTSKGGTQGVEFFQWISVITLVSFILDRTNSAD